MSRVLSLGLVSVLLCGCGASGSTGTETVAEPTSPAPSGSAGTAPPSSSGASSSGGAAAPKGDGRVGSACTGDGDCEASLALECLTEIPAVPQAGFPGAKYPGGYCTRKCGQPDPDRPGYEDLSPDCGKGASCMQQSQSTGQGGSVAMQMCVRTCATDADCRASEGYACKAGVFGQKSCLPR